MSMSRTTSSTELAAHLDAAESLAAHDVKGAQVVLGTLMKTWPNNRGIYLQLQRLADFITKTHEELSSLRPTELKAEFIPKATDELDAIVEATASATNRIMDAAEAIMEVSGRMPQADADKVMTSVNAIFEACTFQDITGQRVSKVVTLLKVIEDRVDKMAMALGEMEPAPECTASVEAMSAMSQVDSNSSVSMSPATDAHWTGSTLNGPALPEHAPSQADIDKILSGESA